MARELDVVVVEHFQGWKVEFEVGHGSLLPPLSRLIVQHFHGATFYATCSAYTAQLACPTRALRSKSRTPQWTTPSEATGGNSTESPELRPLAALCHTANFVTCNTAASKGPLDGCGPQHPPIAYHSFSYYSLRPISRTWSCNRSAVYVLSKVSPATQAGRFLTGP